MSEKTWFITGISRGLGQALAQAVLARGDRVIGTTRNGQSPLPANDRLTVLTLDVTDRSAAFEVVQAAHAKHGRLDVVVNNAGYGLLGSVEASSPEEIRHVMDANFVGTVNVTQAALPFLRKQEAGRIINLSSIAGLAPSAGYAFYAAAKFAVEGFSAGLFDELKPLGIHVTCVEPGAFRTDFLADTSIRHTAKTVDAYAETAGKVGTVLAGMAGKQLGDAAKAAIALCTLADSANPPLHLLLGSDALKRCRGMLAQFTKDIDAWERVTTSTDYADGK